LKKKFQVQGSKFKVHTLPESMSHSMSKPGTATGLFGGGLDVRRYNEKTDAMPIRK
jgi:hypothetical protein